MSEDPNRFAKLRFDDFKALARDHTLSRYERIGFPDSYRAGFEEKIWIDIRQKLSNLDATSRMVLDIGPGCSDLPELISDYCARQQHRLLLIDSSEMLELLPDAPHVEKIAARYPDCPDLFKRRAGAVDVIICYSVLHYIVLDTTFIRFLDSSLSLLAPGGQFLIGDIPNVSKRQRFFASGNGQNFHRQFTGTPDLPVVTFNQIQHDQIDDAMVAFILSRARAQGFDAYVMPQHPDLPMANRREDILITRP